MTIRDLILDIGDETLKQESADAWRLPPCTGKRSHDDNITAAMQDVSKSLQRVEVSELSDVDFVEVYCSVYERVPALFVER